MTDRPKAVFLSYSSADEEAAQRLCEGLRAAGIETWFDRNELRGGDAWDANIRRQIRDCTLLVPVVSASTEARSEGYFRLEWRLAVERSFHFADDQAFLLPVVIDGTRQSSARVPERFRERQWTALPGGTPTPQFIAHVRQLLAGASVAAAPSAAEHAPPLRSGRARLLAAMLAAATVAAALVLGWLQHRATLRAADRKAIAVLPFANLTGHPEDAYLADGLQEEILNALARIRDFKVISRSSVAEFRGAGPNLREVSERLGVGTVLEGSVRRDANTLRLTIQLINAKDDLHLLATNYDRDLGHILGLQSEVARAVADTLAATLSRFERGELDHIGTNNGDAYLSYLRAVALFQHWVPSPDADELHEPARLLAEAVRLDPEFADAYALQSRIYSMSFSQDERAEDAAQARAAFQRALAIDPQLIDARLARGLYELYIAKDLDRALADLEPVAQLRPNSPTAQQALGFALRRRGRIGEALQSFQRAWNLDPLNHAYDLGVLTTCLGLRRFSGALEWARLHQVRFPDIPFPQILSARVHAFTAHSVQPLRALLQRTDLDAENRKSLETQVATQEGRYRDAIKLWESRTDINASTRLAAVAFLYRVAGEAAEAESRLRTLERQLAGDSGTPPSIEVLKTLALVQSMLAEHSAAINTIEQARARTPESLDHVNGPLISFVRSVVLARAGRTAEAYAEVQRLRQVPFSVPFEPFFGDEPPLYLLLRDDPAFDALLQHPPAL